ncbi:MAG TPA: AAA family ATPase [Nocardioides sp.]|uniref:ATP-binding protein n=1 Tax=Nocardioides sp. TaxID=35761 RepID=UPI002C77FD0B|nr:AAA family ATPase [Nocardioides sp.]HQR26432.1 AAA family ATPase [Nocardioides sp.]
MGALPRPDIPPGPQRELNDALHDLHHRVGWPSLRVLARAAGCSHTTVSAVFSSPRLPSWGVVEVLVEAMDGDVGHFHALWLAASAPLSAASGSQPRIAGRRDELAVVRRHLESGSGLLLVAGEAGMGKTRLVSTAVTMDTESVFVASGTCLPLSTEVPFLPVSDVLHAVHAVDGGRWVEEALAGCAGFVPGSLRHLLPELEVRGPVAGLRDEGARHRMFVAVEAALTALADLRPLAVLVEDLHWADSATLDLLEHLVARGTRIPVLGTWRLEDPAIPAAVLDWLTRVRRLGNVDVLELPALTLEETREQLALLWSEPVDPDVVDRVHGRSRGQPLFIEQLAAQPQGSGEMPRLLGDLLDRRLEGLSDQTWVVARALGVGDRPLTDGQLCQVTGLDPEDLTRGLRALETRRLLADPTGPREAQLRHPLLAEAVRRHLVAGEAADQHRRLAQALAAGQDPAPAEVATHWQAAGEPVHELDWRIRAARAAEGRFAMAHAAEQWLRVLELWPPGAASAGSPPVSRWTALAAADDALGESDQILERGVGLLEAALEWAPDLPPGDAAHLYARVGGNRSFHGDPTGLTLLDQSIAFYEQLPPSRGYLQALWERAGAMSRLGRTEEAAADLATGVQVSEAIDDQVLARRLRVEQALIDYGRGDRLAALARMAALAAVDLPSGPDPLGDIFAAANYTDLLLMEGADPDQVEAAARRGLEAAETWGIVSWHESILRFNVAEAAWRAGQVARAAALIDPQTQAPVSLDRWCLHLARAVLDALRGDSGAADQLSDLDRLPATGQRWLLPYAARVELWCRQPQRALDRLLAHLDGLISAGLPRPDAGTFTLTARAAADVLADTDSAARQRRRDELIGRLDQVRSAADGLPIDCDTTADVSSSAASYAAETARLADRQTVEMWVTAATGWDQINRPHDAAYSRWRAAQVALATGRATIATTLLREAARQAREHVPLLEDIAATRDQEHR